MFTALNVLVIAQIVFIVCKIQKSITLKWFFKVWIRIVMFPLRAIEKSSMRVEEKASKSWKKAKKREGWK